jgi:hypothetical protein
VPARVADCNCRSSGSRAEGQLHRAHCRW